MTACPRCKRQDVTPLALIDPDRQRFQCNACSENFTGPKAPAEKPFPGGPKQGVETPALPGFAHVPIAPPDPGEPTGDLVPAGKCEKCGKPYFRLGKKFEEHVLACDGTPFVAPVPRRRRVVQPSAAQPLFTTPAQRAVMPQGTGKALDISIEALKVQRSVLEAEIAELDRTIMTLEKLKGLGGEPSVPFTPPAAPEGSPGPETPPDAQPNVSETVSAPAGA